MVGLPTIPLLSRQTGSAETAGAHPVVVFADDWGRHPSSCQHLARHWLTERSLVWVNTIGTRAPKMDRATIRRAVGKFQSWFRRKPVSTATEIPDRLRVVNPKMWPLFTRRIDRRLNRALLLKQLQPIVEALPEPPTVVTTLPITADLVGRLPVRDWIYYCVDDFGEWPGLDRRTMTRMEADLLTGVDTIIAVSENLRDRLRSMGRDSHLLTHGVDVEFWRPDSAAPSGWTYERPWYVFWGVVDRRMDTGFVRSLAQSLNRGSIILVGPEQEPDPEMVSSARVFRPGPQPIERLPSIAAEADVLIMPYADLPVTRAIQPLKLKEYLATGKPTVVRDLPANRPWADCLDMVATVPDFVRIAHERADSGTPADQIRARRRLENERWSAKARQFAEFAGWSGS